MQWDIAQLFQKAICKPKQAAFYGIHIINAGIYGSKENKNEKKLKIRKQEKKNNLLLFESAIFLQN